MTARSRPRLLGHRARLDADGEVLVDGRRVAGSRRWRRTSSAPRAPARDWCARSSCTERFDILPLLVMTDGAIETISEASLAAGSVETDRRRFRPNLLIAGVPGLAERGWEGRRLRVGEVVVAFGRPPRALCHDDFRSRHPRAGAARAAHRLRAHRRGPRPERRSRARRPPPRRRSGRAPGKLKCWIRMPYLEVRLGPRRAPEPRDSPSQLRL